MAAKGVHVATVRLPQVHEARQQGLATRVIQIAREKGVSALSGLPARVKEGCGQLGV